MLRIVPKYLNFEIISKKCVRVLRPLGKLGKKQQSLTFQIQHDTNDVVRDFVVDFEDISHLFLVFLLMDLNS